MEITERCNFATNQTTLAEIVCIASGFVKTGGVFVIETIFVLLTIPMSRTHQTNRAILAGSEN